MNETDLIDGCLTQPTTLGELFEAIQSYDHQLVLVGDDRATKLWTRFMASAQPLIDSARERCVPYHTLRISAASANAWINSYRVLTAEVFGFDPVY